MRNETVFKTDLLIINIDATEIIAKSGHGNPHDPGDWKPGDGKPPWAGGGKNNNEDESSYRNSLWNE